MGSVLMAIGDILFYRPFPGDETPSFETVARDMAATVPAQSRLGRDNAIQFTGPGEETITVHGRIFPYIFGGLDTLDQLRDALRAGQPMSIVQFSPNMNLGGDPISPSGATYTGNYVGEYMIRSLKKGSSLFTSDGIPNKVDFTLELVLYGDDLSPGTFSISTLGSSTPSTPAASPATPATPSQTSIPAGTTSTFWSGNA